MSKTRWLSLPPASSQPLVSLGESAARAALAGHIVGVFQLRAEREECYLEARDLELAEEGQLLEAHPGS